MANTKDPTGGMGNLSNKTKKKVDEQLRDIELELLLNTSIDINSLRPHISDKESFDALVGAINASTRCNETTAQLRQQIVSLGAGVRKVAADVISIVKKA